MRAQGPREDVLASALRALHAALKAPRLAMAAADDPLRLALPPLLATAPLPSAATLAAYAALYLHAELEEAGVIAAAEALAENRYQLQLQDTATAARLERFAQDARNYPTRAERQLRLARLFGLQALASGALAAGAGWGGESGGARDFLQRMARLATSIVRADHERQRLGGRAGLASQAAWQAAAQAINSLLMAESAGTLQHWAQRLHERVLQAFAVLGDAGLMRQLGSRSPWQTLQHIVGPADMARREAAARRGAAGQALLRALGAALASPLRADAAPDAASVQAALRWLNASALPLPELWPMPQPAAPAPPLPTTAFAQSPAQAASTELQAQDALPGDAWAEVALA